MPGVVPGNRPGAVPGAVPGDGPGNRAGTKLLPSCFTNKEHTTGCVSLDPKDPAGSSTEYGYKI